MHFITDLNHYPKLSPFLFLLSSSPYHSHDSLSSEGISLIYFGCSDIYGLGRRTEMRCAKSWNEQTGVGLASVAAQACALGDDDVVSLWAKLYPKSQRVTHGAKELKRGPYFVTFGRSRTFHRYSLMYRSISISTGFFSYIVCPRGFIHMKTVLKAHSTTSQKCYFLTFMVL